MSGPPLLRRPRWRERMKAHSGGYFWEPCDVCGEHFGGHERGGGWILLNDSQSTMTCPQCPGAWIEWHGRYAKLEVQLVGGKPAVVWILGGSDWPSTVDQALRV